MEVLATEFLKGVNYRGCLGITARQVREDAAIKSLTVSVQGDEYIVDYGWGANRRFHRVNKQRECSCGDPDCPAIDAVRAYLRAGGIRATDPEGMPPCPICGSRTRRDRHWDGKYTHELGWRCEKGGLSHFMQAKTARIQKNFLERARRYPPKLVESSVRWESCLTHEDRE